MAEHKVAYIGRAAPDTTLIENGLEGLDYEIDISIVETQGEIIEACKGADVILNGGVEMPREVIEEIDTAQAIIVGSHGFNHIDHNAATDQGVMIINSAGFCTEEVSNHAILMLMACAKKLTILHNLVREGKWGAETRNAIMPMAPIDGQTLGLVAFGNIARAVARKAQALGMDVITYDPYCPPWITKEYRVKPVATLEELAADSDFVSMHTPLNDETRKLVGADFFKAMKPTAYFINTCRGPYRGRGGDDRGAEQRRNRGRGLGCVRGRADAGGQPSAEDGQCNRYAALCGQFQQLARYIAHPRRTRNRARAEGQLPDVHRQPRSALQAADTRAGGQCITNTDGQDNSFPLDGGRLGWG